MTTTAQIEMSEPTVGMTHTFDLEMDVGANLTGSVTFKIKEKTQLLGYDVYVLTMNGGGSFSNGFTGTWSMSITTYKRLSDKAIVKEQGTVTMTYDYMGSTVTTSVEVTETNNPPLDVNDFPINLYETWTANTTRTTLTVYKFNGVEDRRTTETEFVKYEMECLGEKTVTVPAGTYTGYEIKYAEIGGTYSIEVVSPELNATVLSEDFEADGTKIGSMKLVSYGMEEEDQFDLYLLLAILVIGVVMIGAVAAAMARRRRMEEYPSEYDHKEEEKPPYW